MDKNYKRLSIGALVVKQGMFELLEPNDVDMEYCTEIAKRYCADMPEIKAETVEQADELAKRVMEWCKNVHNKRVLDKPLRIDHALVVGGMLQMKIDSLHLEMEQLLYDLEVVERGTADTQEQDT